MCLTDILINNKVFLATGFFGTAEILINANYVSMLYHHANEAGAELNACDVGISCRLGAI